MKAAVDTDFEALMRRLRHGDAAAYDDLYVRYGSAIRRAVRQHLHSRLRPQFDSFDFVQDVWASFVALPVDQYTFADTDSLGRFLTRVARNKVIEVYRRRFRTRGYDIRREQVVAPTPAVPEPAVIDRGPSPSQVAMAGERWEVMSRMLPDGHRAILERLSEGHTHEDVAEQLGVSVRTVERVVRRLKDLCGN